MIIMDKKTKVKTIESHLRAYKSYKVAIRNLQNTEKDIPKLKELQLIVDSIDSALEALEETEREFIVARYFNENSFINISLDMGYSHSTLHVLRRKAMDKLLISLVNLFYLEGAM